MPDGKGNAQWRPATRMGVVHKKDGYGYRFLLNEADNIESKQMEGWVIPNKTNGMAGEFLEDKDKTSGGKRHKELVLAVMDNETIKKRDAYFQTQADAQVSGLKNKMQRELASSSSTAVAHGTIEGHPAAPVIQ